MILNTLRNAFLLARPYSIPNIILVVLATIIISGKESLDFSVLIPIIIGILFWSSSVYLLEFAHKLADGRQEFFSNYFLAIPTILLIILLFFYSPLGILIFALAFLSVWLYSLKVYDLPFSHLMFIFRPFTEIGIIFTIYLMYSNDFSSSFLYVLIGAIYFISLSRNLIGDLRDKNHDKNTLPKKIGEKYTRLVSFLAGLIALAIIGPNFEVIPIILALILILFKVNYYATHKIYILLTTFYLSLFASRVLGLEIIIILIVLIAIILILSYDFVPRKSNNEKPRWF